jgi:hypothetical protein
LAGIYDPDEAERIAEAEQGQQGTANGNTSKADRIAAQLQNHPAVIDTEAVSEALETETATVEAPILKIDPPIDEKTEKKKLRKSIKELFPEELIEKFTGGRDINALDLNELVQLKDGLTDYKE